MMGDIIVLDTILELLMEEKEKSVEATLKCLEDDSKENYSQYLVSRHRIDVLLELLKRLGHINEDEHNYFRDDI